MAPPPEYDKEPKAPDKSATTIANDDSKLLHSIVNDQQINSDHKPSNTAANTEVENNKQVVNLDDGQLRALLDEAMNYKCPKDLEGKSNLFKELLEEVEQQDDQASEAAARGVGAGRGARRSAGAGGGGARSRHTLHSNSLQDLVAALAAESAPRRPRHHAPAPVSARAIQGGSLPSGVDTSFLLGEEGGGARYLATVRCVNPPPLAERRVSASDANCPAEVEPLNNRRSKPVFPMTYTARATLEIGSGSVCSGRAVTTTTASNQVRTPPAAQPPRSPAPPRLTTPDPNPNQKKLMNALYPKGEPNKKSNPPVEGKTRKPRGPSMKPNPRENQPQHRTPDGHALRESPATRQHFSPLSDQWMSGVDKWYEGLAAYHDAFRQISRGGPPHQRNQSQVDYRKDSPEVNPHEVAITQTNYRPNSPNADPNIPNNIAPGKSVREQSKSTCSKKTTMPILTPDSIKYVSKKKTSNQVTKESQSNKIVIFDESRELYRVDRKLCDIDESDIRFRKKYRERVGYNLEAPKFIANPKNIRKMTISTAPVINISEPRRSSDVIETTSDNKDINIVSKNIKVVKDRVSKEENVYEEIGKDSDYNISNEKFGNGKECIAEIEMIEFSLKRIDNHTNNLTFTDNETVTEIKAINNSFKKSDEDNNNDIELADFVSKSQHKREENSFLQFCATQEKLFQALETTDVNENLQLHHYSEDQNSKLLEIPDKDKDVENLIKSKVKLLNEQIRETVAEDTSPKVVDNSEDRSEGFSKDDQNCKLLEIPDKNKSGGDLVKSKEELLSEQIRETTAADIVPNVKKSSEDEAEDSSKKDQNQPEKDKDIEDLVESKDKLLKEQIRETVADETVADETVPNVEENLKDSYEDSRSNELVIQLKKPNDKVSNDQYILAELPNNAYVFLTLPKRLLMPLHNKDQKPFLQIHEMQNNTNTSEDTTVAKVSNKKKKEKVIGVTDDTKRKDAINKTALKVLLFENLKRDVSIKPGASTVAGDEGDSAIPFSCITTPEVVASCNTTSSTPQSAVAVDPKPLQLSSGYRAVASLTGAPPPAPAPVPRPDPPAARQLQVFVPRLGLQPRSVISSSFNGLPLTRPSYGAAPAPDDYKKSLDENGNAVQGFSSPVSGSSQHKKPRRKKSSKNETVIKSHQIDGYQGNKDLNEVLRFIESNADAGRGKLADKGKKRSTERRKDKDKPKRASSLEELSRTRLEDLTAPRPPGPAPPAPKPERRSWGDDARPAFYFAPDPAPAAPAPAPAPAPATPTPAPDPAPELTDFQTVTKRRKPRRRTDEAEREPPRRPRPPSPSARPRRESAPPSDRSNDSNDDLDSVHSLPPAPAAAPAAPAPHASYADIARTRHNIPDLIESCNFYAEGEGEAGRGAAAAGDEYPALGPRRAKPPRAVRKERAPKPKARDCVAPDVVGDRRPPVILLDAGARPRDMDGVTFGFDINEQLLTGPARRPRCDLVRDALELEGSTPTGATAAGSVAVGPRALRYVAPAPPADTHHLHQIVDYVGNAWEDVVRCGGGKVRYFSE